MYPKAYITSVGLITAFTKDFENFINSKIPERDKCSTDFFDLKNHSICNISKDSLDISSKDSRIMGKHTLMLIKASEEAYKKTGFDRYNPEEIGYFSAIGMIDYENEDLLSAVIKSMKEGQFDLQEFFKKGYREIYPLWPLSMLNNISLCQSAIRLNIKGDNCVFTPHSDASLHSINEAIWSISNNKSKVALAGAVSEVISPQSIARYILCNTNKSRVSSPEMPVDIYMAEGSVFFAIEGETTENKKLASLSGFGASFGFDDVSGGVTEQAVKSSMYQACRGKKVDLVFTHYSRQQDSFNEISAIKGIFGDDVEFVSTKSLIGDMLTCAGAFDCALAVSLLNDKMPVFINGHVKEKKYNTILINAFSVEGNVTSILVERV
ncbi:MAG TPA: hypothetical protein HPP56_08695 [Nitrospirae bacterium]|nr:hypothetical protein [Nitrospirota bacterium]